MSKSNNRGNTHNSPQPVTETETVVSQRPAHIDNGAEARGDVNSRENQTSTQPEPSDAVVALGDTVIAMRPPKTARGSIMESRREMLSTAGQTKHQLLTVTKQKLAEAADLFNQGGEKTAEGRKIADTCAVQLFTARADGVLDAEALTAMLGDSFGFKAKKGDKEKPVKAGDPDASKTPFGNGEAIRKRVVRAVQAHEYVAGTDASKFFNGLPADKVSDLLQKVRKGQLSLWSAYDYMGDLKREAGNVKVSPAFDTKAIAKIVEGLRETDAAARYLSNPDLQDAYLALHDMIVQTDREATALKAKRAAA